MTSSSLQLRFLFGVVLTSISEFCYCPNIVFFSFSLFHCFSICAATTSVCPQTATLLVPRHPSATSSVPHHRMPRHRVPRHRMPRHQVPRHRLISKFFSVQPSPPRVCSFHGFLLQKFHFHVFWCILGASKMLKIYHFHVFWLLQKCSKSSIFVCFGV